MSREFDYIVIGGGSAGCVIAGRLSEDPAVSVCVLEAGDKADSRVVKIPFGMIALVPTKRNNWAFDTVPQRGLNNRIGYQPRGKGLGGSSAINAMAYTRGHPNDYDAWAELGCAGWSFKDVLPYFRLSEQNARLKNEWHGSDGPLHVSDLQTGNPFQQRFLEAAREIQLPSTDDFNGANQEGVGIYQVTQKNGERWSAARAYLHPHIGKRKNLRVETGAAVRRIVFEDKRAVAVEFITGNTTHVLRAKREIILCAGALQSPHLLMLSGIGDTEELQQAGITARHHLPGVGKNLQDHPDFVFSYASDSLDTMGLSLRGTFSLMKQTFRYIVSRRGMLATNFAECGAFLRTSTELNKPDIQLHFVVAKVADHGRKLEPGHGFSCHVCLLRPHSVGSLRIVSADPDIPPLIDPAFLTDDRDVEELVAGFKLTRKLLEAPALANWATKDLVTANVRSDDDIRAVLRERVDTVYHPVGTCKMGLDDMAVVDPQLRVRGIDGLRVVDASIMPKLVGANTNAPTIMIAEKAVDLIRNQQRTV